MATDPPEVPPGHDATFAPATRRGAKMPSIDPTLVGAAFAHELAIGAVADAPVEMATEPKLKIDTTQKITREFLRAFIILSVLEPIDRDGSSRRARSLLHPHVDEKP